MITLELISPTVYADHDDKDKETVFNRHLSLKCEKS